MFIVPVAWFSCLFASHCLVENAITSGTNGAATLFRTARDRGADHSGNGRAMTTTLERYCRPSQSSQVTSTRRPGDLLAEQAARRGRRANPCCRCARCETTYRIGPEATVTVTWSPEVSRSRSSSAPPPSCTVCPVSRALPRRSPGRAPAAHHPRVDGVAGRDQDAVGGLDRHHRRLDVEGREGDLARCSRPRLARLRRKRSHRAPRRGAMDPAARRACPGPAPAPESPDWAIQVPTPTRSRARQRQPATGRGDLVRSPCSPAAGSRSQLTTTRHECRAGQTGPEADQDQRDRRAGRAPLLPRPASTTVGTSPGWFVTVG